MAEGDDGRRPALRPATIVAALVALALTAGAVWATYLGVHDQSKRLLKERTAEINLVLTQAISAIPTGLQQLGAVLSATNGETAAFQSAAQQQVDASPTPVQFAWLRPASSGDGFEVVDAVGTGDLQVGQTLTDERARTMRKALASTLMVPTPVIGKDRMLGFALGPPSSPADTVLYRQTTLGPAVQPPRAAGSAPFSELDVALYAGRSESSTVLTATTQDLPLSGEVQRTTLDAGVAHWRLVVKARSPLVGRITADAPWLVLAAGLLGTVLLGLVVEAVGRRRDAALELYRVEHQVAETLQRSLLPRLPELAGLDLAARYLASGVGQEVGGDWFDAFPIAGDRCGLVVGDVIGHDVAAASAMAQIRALLRGYAVDGGSPADVLSRLDHVIDQLQLTQLVTVFYGLLEPPAADGSRLMRYSNAGHVPPIVCLPDGQVEALDGGASVVIGAPISAEYVESEHRLAPGATVVMFTDGLVEVPGGSLTDGLDRLAQNIAALRDMAPEELCDDLLSDASQQSLRDDVALLVVRLASAGGIRSERGREEAVSRPGS
jgi:hypothetical protein